MWGGQTGWNFSVTHGTLCRHQARLSRSNCFIKFTGLSEMSRRNFTLDRSAITALNDKCCVDATISSTHHTATTADERLTALPACQRAIDDLPPAQFATRPSIDPPVLPRAGACASPNGVVARSRPPRHSNSLLP